MEFFSANPSVIRSIKQRVLLNTWLRAARKRQPLLPVLAGFGPDANDDERADMIGYEVRGDGSDARFLITQHGSRLAATYGNDRPYPGQVNRYLDDAIGPDRYARVVPSYRACVARKRPTYSVSTVQDADGKDVSYERLLLPFGNADAVEQIVGSFKAISIEGGFKIDNLMGLKSPRVPVTVVNAVIDLDFFPAAQVARGSDDVVELN